jgi:hypothetical protein
MGNKKHTPAPWRIVTEEKGYQFGRKKEERRGQAICSVENAFSQIAIHAEPDDKPCPSIEKWNEEAEANARLITAAPELLTALENLVLWMEKSGLSTTKAGGVGVFAYEGSEYSVVTEAKEAIKKAITVCVSVVLLAFGATAQNQEPKKWAVESVQFQENYKGDGTGIFVVPEDKWRESHWFSVASLATNGDTLLLRFMAIDTFSMVLLNCKGVVPEVARKEVTLFHKSETQAVWEWKIYMVGQWVGLFRDRKARFKFNAEFYGP